MVAWSETGHSDECLALTPDGSDGIMELVRESDKGAFHVGLNAHLLSCGESYRSAGINWYIQNLLSHLPELFQRQGPA